MNPQRGLPEQIPIESDLWDALDRIPGTDSQDAMEFVYQWARWSEGIVILSRPSARIVGSAVLGVLASGSTLGPARVYLADPRRQQLTLLFGELSKLNLASEVTLYHGSLTQLFRDLPLSADLICTHANALDLSAGGGLHSVLASGTIILRPRTTAQEADRPTADLIDGGFITLEAVHKGGVAYRATDRCRGARFVPRTGLRVRLQGLLHECYFRSEAEDASHTPVADLTEDIRKEFTREFPAASGSGSWPYGAPERTLPPTLPSGKPWPKVSIVTPTLNQGRYLEETILSVLHQDYPDIEHIIVDGASTDETPSVLARYRHKLALVISEPDNGQSHAINKGMSKATGEILTWLNSDDMLAPGALAAAALALDLNGCDMIAGICRLYRDGSLETQHLTSCADGPLPLEDLLDLDQGWNAGQFFVQPEVMFTRDIWLRAGGQVNERLAYTMDYELWLRFARAGARLHVVGRPLAWFRLHEEQKISARSRVVLELAASRDAFLRESRLALNASTTPTPWRQKLRIALLADGGDLNGPGGAHVRLARALAWAGHDVSLVATQDTPAQAESVFDRVSATRPDLVIVDNHQNANAGPMLPHRLSRRTPMLMVSQVVRSSVTLDVFCPRNKQDCREYLGLPADRFLILLQASTEEANDEARALVNALARLEPPNVLVITMGCKVAGTLDGAMKVVELDYIINDPNRLAMLYAATDVVVALNPAGTFERAYIDAIACGTPVAGYPAAAVPEGIRDGVTGIVASGNNAASLAAAIHHLYIHPELRNDLARWGRLHLENEWSEFSGYRHFFLALDRLGLMQFMNLRRKIEFLPQEPGFSPLQERRDGLFELAEPRSILTDQAGR